MSCAGLTALAPAGATAATLDQSQTASGAGGTFSGTVAFLRIPWPRRLVLPALLLLAALALSVPSAASAATFSNGAGIAINNPASGCGAEDLQATPAQAAPYPSTIAVSGFSGTVGDLNVTITGLSHTFPDDVGIVLVGPTGASTVLMEDSGQNADVSGVNLTFDDAASSSLPDSSQITSGTYKPSQGTQMTGGGDGCTPPSTYPDAPAGPYGGTLAGFNGTDPNGPGRCT